MIDGKIIFNGFKAEKEIYGKINYPTTAQINDKFITRQYYIYKTKD